jgi:hypothetical protein
MSAEFKLTLHDGAKVKVAVVVTPANADQETAAPAARCRDLANQLSGWVAGAAPRLVCASSVDDLKPEHDHRRN